MLRTFFRVKTEPLLDLRNRFWQSRAFLEGKAWLREVRKAEDATFFQKKSVENATKIAQLWWNLNGKSPVVPCYPDFAFTSPFPKIVFEAKLFRSGGPDAAKTELVRGIYQCVFYRSLPYSAGSKDYAEWDYPAACLLIYDASESQSVVKAWAKDSVRKDVKEGTWESANVYVMVLPHEG